VRQRLDRSYTPAQLRDMGRPFYVGYKEQLRAALVMAYQAAQRNIPYSLLLVGLPGTGKTLFPQVLAYELCRAGLDYSYVWIPCGRYAALYQPADALGYLQEVNVTEVEPSSRTVIALDEIDAIGIDRADSISGATVSHWTLDTLRTLAERSGARLILGISNYPLNLDRAILSQIGTGMYFGLPTDEQGAKILAHGGIPDAVGVLAAYKALCSGNRCTFTGRTLENAAASLRLFHADDCDSFGIDRLGRDLFAEGRLITIQKVRDYEDQNSWIINPARLLTESLQANFSRLVGEGLLVEVYDPDEQPADGQCSRDGP
jgi:hypothetical protein